MSNESPLCDSGKPPLTVDTTQEQLEPTNSSNYGSQASTPQHAAPQSTNVFVAGIPSNWDDAKLREIFEPYGEIQSTRIVSARHYAFVMFRSRDAADAAIAGVHLSRPGMGSGNVLHVTIAMHDEGAGEVPNERLFIRGLPQWVNKDHLRETMEKYGEITEVNVLMNPYGLCKGAGFISYKTVDEAQTALKDAANIRIENWDFPLEVKYSETQDARQQRQMRNFDRLRKSNPPTPSNAAASSTPTNQGGMLPQYHVQLGQNQPLRSPSGPPPFPLVATQGVQGSLLPLPPPPPGAPAPAGQQMMRTSPQMQQLSPPAQPPVLLNQQSPQQQQGILPSPQGAAPQGMLPSPQGAAPPSQLNQPSQSTPIVVPGPGSPFPSTGDLFLCGVPGNEDTVRQLLQQFGAIEFLQPAAGVTGGFVVRLASTPHHVNAAQVLNGTTFSTGHVLQVALIA